MADETSGIDGVSEERLEEEEFYDLSTIQGVVDLVQAVRENKTEHSKQQIAHHIGKLISDSGLSEYKLLFLYAPKESIDDSTANQLYAAMPAKGETDLLLIINSPGGSIESAYLISKCFKEYARKFVVCVPRKAKSAATLLALGADEIHMGMMSELGPIDPQFGGLPALGLSSAVEHFARLCKQYPESSDMFAKYLSIKLDLPTLGYFERVSESATQYAQRLLEGKQLPEGKDPAAVAHQLVYAYKDHSFVIDKDEARKILGEHIKNDTPEYHLGNQIHNFLHRLNLVYTILKEEKFSVVGDEGGVSFSDSKGPD